jgi:PPOX class probable F420-dependent enzyme
MSVGERIADLQYRFYDGVRSRKAAEAAANPGRAGGFAAFEGKHYALVVTFKRSGEPVPTPVLFAVEDGKLYFRTEERVAKVKRIRNDAHVRVGPCNSRGKPTGALTEGSARILPGEEIPRARAALRANYTLPMRAYEGVVDRIPAELAYVEVTPN